LEKGKLGIGREKRIWDCNRYKSYAKLGIEEGNELEIRTWERSQRRVDKFSAYLSLCKKSIT